MDSFSGVKGWGMTVKVFARSNRKEVILSITSPKPRFLVPTGRTAPSILLSQPSISLLSFPWSTHVVYHFSTRSTEITPQFSSPPLPGAPIGPCLYGYVVSGWFATEDSTEVEDEVEDGERRTENGSTPLRRLTERLQPLKV